MFFVRFSPLFATGLVFVALARAQAPEQTVTAVSPPHVALSPEEMGDLDIAKKMFREAIAEYKKAPANSAIVANKIGIAWHHLGEFNLALASYQRAVKLNKNYAEAINNIGTVYYAQKRYRTAIGRYKRALQLAPDHAAYWSNLGTAYYSIGKFKEMMENYNKAIAIDPGIFEARGLVGTEIQDRNVADRARYHFVMARLYAKTGNNDLALQYLRRCFEEGFKDKEAVRKSPEFARMLENPQFIEVMALEPRVL